MVHVLGYIHKFENALSFCAKFIPVFNPLFLEKSSILLHGSQSGFTPFAPHTHTNSSVLANMIFVPVSIIQTETTTRHDAVTQTSQRRVHARVPRGLRKSYENKTNIRDDRPRDRGDTSTKCALTRHPTTRSQPTPLAVTDDDAGRVWRTNWRGTFHPFNAQARSLQTVRMQPGCCGCCSFAFRTQH